MRHNFDKIEIYLPSFAFEVISTMTGLGFMLLLTFTILLPLLFKVNNNSSNNSKNNNNNNNNSNNSSSSSNNVEVDGSGGVTAR